MYCFECSEGAFFICLQRILIGQLVGLTKTFLGKHDFFNPSSIHPRWIRYFANIIVTGSITLFRITELLSNTIYCLSFASSPNGRLSPITGVSACLLKNI